MSDSLKLNDAVLSGAGRKLVEAAVGMLNNNVRRPVAVPTISGASAEIDIYLRGLSVARAALADAAKSASLALSSTMERSAALDSEIAAALPAGYSLREGAT